MEERENKPQEETETKQSCEESQSLDGEKTQKDKKAPKEELDTETTFADMNVEGFSWYNPKKKKGKSEKINVSRKEYWAMVRGAFAAMLPMILCLFTAMGIVFLLAYLWLK